MSITWHDIKLITMQKMFAINNGSTRLPTDSMGKDYLSAMPAAANEALTMLATVGKFIIKSIDIANIPVPSLIPGNCKIHSVTRGDITYEAVGAKSLYYELKGKGTLSIQIGEGTEEEPVEPTVTEFDTTESKGYVPFKAILDNPDDLKVIVTFSSDYPMSVKDFALYAAEYENADDIPPYTPYVRYDLSELAEDFYAVIPEKVIYEGDCPFARYTATSNYFQEGYKTFVIPRNIWGNWKIYYKAYPQHLTLTTPDDTELALDPEVADLLPLYMASQIYKDDDPSIATQYRNEFEVAFERLQKNVNAPSQEHFRSVTGWI